MTSSPESLARLLVASLNDAARISSLLDIAMQQGSQPAFEVSPQGVIWYLNQAASEVIGTEPQQAVNTRLANYVVDGLMTQRRLEALSHSQSASWRDAWRGKGKTTTCELTAFAIPQSVVSERARIVVWAKSPSAHPPEEHLISSNDIKNESPAEILLLPDQLVMTSDLERLREKLGISTNRFCEILGISMVTWYAWRKTPEQPIASRPIILHLRLLDAMPELARLGPQPIDLQEALRTHLGISFTFSELALWMGVERRAGYAWSRGYPASDQVRALTASLLYIVLNKPREAWLRYQNLLQQQAQLEGIDFTKIKSWSSAARGESELLEAESNPAPEHQPPLSAKRPHTRSLGTIHRSGQRRSRGKKDDTIS